jgi:large subunit ribosomal protein L21
MVSAQLNLQVASAAAFPGLSGLPWSRALEECMYAVIQTGGKQYRVAPGDVVKVESLTAAEDGSVEFGTVLAFSGESGSLVKPQSAKVLGTVVAQGRGDKILVFHFKRKKQYKKLQGHRQGFTQVRISEIQVDGNSYTA